MQPPFSSLTARRLSSVMRAVPQVVVGAPAKFPQVNLPGVAQKESLSIIATLPVYAGVFGSLPKQKHSRADENEAYESDDDDGVFIQRMGTADRTGSASDKPKWQLAAWNRKMHYVAASLYISIKLTWPVGMEIGEGSTVYVMPGLACISAFYLTAAIRGEVKAARNWSDVPVILFKPRDPDAESLSRRTVPHKQLQHSPTLFQGARCLWPVTQSGSLFHPKAGHAEEGALVNKAPALEWKTSGPKRSHNAAQNDRPQAAASAQLWGLAHIRMASPGSQSKSRRLGSLLCALLVVHQPTGTSIREGT
ncbi:hypothetical protein EVG20_g2120 [Dentipellis fragilis]|uniref:Uncharacterized protein n=1 Tax=Dentipellis fragilis TaxID=205917 RepID=A0A4Y9ZAM0_9AGAM|nr:hypothetical protein EVG20_g2120 [Dentipellis fragilis]